jgi:hypothetical protein
MAHCTASLGVSQLCEADALFIHPADSGVPYTRHMQRLISALALVGINVSERGKKKHNVSHRFVYGSWIGDTART